MKHAWVIVTALAALLLLNMCSAPRYGSVDAEGLQEALSSPRMALTPHQPWWLLNDKQTHPLSATQLERVRSILRPEKQRNVPEDYYRDETAGNRGDSSTQLFYLYTGSGQCLGGRVIDNKVLMDDFELSEQECAELYALFRSQLSAILKSSR